MKVLLLHQHFNTPYSGGALRSYYLAKALVDHGHSVIVITTWIKREYTIKHIDGIEVHYLPIPYQNGYGFYKRSLAFMRYVWRAVSLSRQFQDSDICYAISVPLTVGIAAMRIQSLYKIRFIFEVGDLWPDAPIQMGVVKNKIFQNILYRLEKKIYRSAKVIVALSPAIQEAIEKKVPGKTIHLIPNMSDTEFFKPEEKDGALERQYGVEGKFVVSYIGALGPANGLDHFLKCAMASHQSSLPVHFLLCGEGGMLEHLKSDLQKLKLENFSIIPFQDRYGVKKILNVTDATFISYRPIPVLETGSPNKFFDGLAAGKLVIINFGGWIQKEIEESRCGIFVNPSSGKDFVVKILPFIESNERLRSFQAAARLLAERNYSRHYLSKRFADIFGQPNL